MERSEPPYPLIRGARHTERSEPPYPPCQGGKTETPISKHARFPSPCIHIDTTPISRYHNNQMRPYEYLEHTADMGLRVRGETLAGLLMNAAHALFETIAVLTTIDETDTLDIQLTAESVEDLFVAWLDELIFLHETEAVFFKRAHIHRCTETAVTATVHGEPANRQKHEVYTEIKSVTYHQLRVEKTADNTWLAEVIFDL